MADQVERLPIGQPARLKIALVEGQQVLIQTTERHRVASFALEGKVRQGHQLDRLAEGARRRRRHVVRHPGRLDQAAGRRGISPAGDIGGEGLQSQDHPAQRDLLVLAGMGRQRGLGPGDEAPDAEGEQRRIVRQRMVPAGPEIALPAGLVLGDERVEVRLRHPLGQLLGEPADVATTEPVALVEMQRILHQHPPEGQCPHDRLRLPRRLAIGQRTPRRTQIELGSGTRSHQL